MLVLDVGRQAGGGGPGFQARQPSVASRLPGRLGNGVGTRQHSMTLDAERQLGQTLSAEQGPSPNWRLPATGFPGPNGPPRSWPWPVGSRSGVWIG